MMQAADGSVVARDVELAQVQRFVTGFRSGPASLTLEGAAGIGKTAIWGQALLAAKAAGVTVRACRCSQSDAALAFAGLGDLFDGLDRDALDELPDVQRRALSAALLLSDVSDHEPLPGTRAVGVAVLGMLRAMARTAPLLLAVDDVQWLDASSRNALSFALRRLDDEPIRLVASCRSGLLGDLSPTLGLPGERVPVGAVTVGGMQRILQIRLGSTMGRPVLTRLHRATGGNPMMCLEMARALHRRGIEPAPSEPLPVPADFRLLVTERLRGLGPATRDMLLVIAALAQPTVGAIEHALGDAELTGTCLQEAAAAGVLELDGGRVRFTHPLIASIPYEELTERARRALHTRVASSVSDLEERARHAALGSHEPSAGVAAALDVAAQHARRRGSLDAAAELARLALSLTPADDRSDCLRRSVDVAEYLYLLGDPAGARAVLSDAGLESAPPGPGRVPALLLLAAIASWESGDAMVSRLCEQALVEAGDDSMLLARVHARFAETSPSGAAADLFHAQAAVSLLETMQAPPAGVLASSLTNVASHRLRLGHGLEVETLERAATLEAVADPVPVVDRAALALGMYLKVVDRFEDSRGWLEAVRTAAIDEGDDSALPIILGHLAALECWAGRYKTGGRPSHPGS